MLADVLIDCMPTELLPATQRAHGRNVKVINNRKRSYLHVIVSTSFPWLSLLPFLKPFHSLIILVLSLRNYLFSVTSYTLILSIFLSPFLGSEVFPFFSLLFFLPYPHSPSKSHNKDIRKGGDMNGIRSEGRWAKVKEGKTVPSTSDSMVFPFPSSQLPLLQSLLALHEQLTKLDENLSSTTPNLLSHSHNRPLSHLSLNSSIPVSRLLPSTLFITLSITSTQSLPHPHNTPVLSSARDWMRGGKCWFVGEERW